MAFLFHLSLFSVLIRTFVVLGADSPSMSSSAEFRLRKSLFAQHDRMVRPVLNPSDAVNVTFDLQLKSLVDVSNKDQVITTDMLVVQNWNNPFLRWNPSDYDETSHILMSPDEIWVPDIVLENNGDSTIVQAGHLKKFRSWVLVDNSGQNMWYSSSTFKSTCSLDVKFFPFDKQHCSMVFRSLTADESFMDIKAAKIESDDPEKDLKLSNGYWSLRHFKIDTDEHSLGPRRFRKVVVSFEIGRKPTFFVLFSLVPCMIIGMLILVSFFIPAESGERIGLCATIMLAVSVYLLVVTEQLPEQSDTLPLIGVYYIVVMFEIGMALAATVLVLMAHHGTSEPPRFLKCLTAINKIRFCGRKKKESDKVISPAAGVGNEVVVQETETVEMKDMDKPKLTAYAHRPSTAITFVTINEDAQNEEAWKEIGRALDRIFFWFFVVLFALTSIVIYSQAGRL